MTASTLPAPLREIGFDQNIGTYVPLDISFRDESGGTIALGDYFGKHPVVMVFAYYEFPMPCTMVINGLASALDVLSLVPGKDFEIVTVSFDPRDTAAMATATAKKTGYLGAMVSKRGSLQAPRDRVAHVRPAPAGFPVAGRGPTH